MNEHTTGRQIGRRGFLRTLGVAAGTLAVTPLQQATAYASAHLPAIASPALLRARPNHTPTPFSVKIPNDILRDIAKRVRSYEWLESPSNNDTWSYGTNREYLRELCSYWATSYNWQVHERMLNRFSHFKATVEDLELHFIHERGSGPNPQPLILLHGWPGSFFEFAHLIEPLAHPERFGGDAADAFDVIVPSLPGYGFSGKPANPLGPRQVAALFDGLMTDVLGYQRYIAQGGDWGSLISGWLGFDHAPACRAIHLNMLGLRHHGAVTLGPPSEQDLTEEERAWVVQQGGALQTESAYAMLQMTRPQTLSYAMMDSPVGAAAWIIEKFYAWSDRRERDFESCFTRDQLLTNVMIYLVTRTFNTATWMYRGYAEGPLTMPPGARVEVPTGFAAFLDGVYAPPPRSYVERGYNVVHWTDMPRGGHFAALEAPDLFLEDLRAFGRLVRTGT